MTLPKFRAWIHEGNAMVPPNEINGIDFIGKSVLFTRRWWDEDRTLYEEDIEVQIGNAVLMQSTGLLDENGVEVFEGDIVDFQVPNQELCGIYEVRQAKSGEWRIDNNVQGRSLYIAGSHHCNVIGNIYENKELLEVTE